MTTTDEATSHPIRWGVIGTGSIAHTVTEDLLLLPDECTVTAVASRTRERAQEFAEQYRLSNAFGSYEELATSPDVDVVYVANTHNEHLAAALLCLEHGKHVLCEKPLTTSVAETEQLLDAAAAASLFVMEALWSRTNPLVRKVAELVSSGALGDLRHVRAEFAWRFTGEDDHRMLNPDLAGGAILDLGVYPTHLVDLIAGEPTELTAYGHLGHTGVDTHSMLAMAIPSRTGGADVTATCYTSLETGSTNDAEILLTGGRILMENFHKCERARVFRPADDGWDEEVLETHLPGHGYTFQAQEVHACIRAGRVESSLVPWASTRAVARTLERWRAQLS